MACRRTQEISAHRFNWSCITITIEWAIPDSQSTRRVREYARWGLTSRNKQKCKDPAFTNLWSTRTLTFRCSSPSFHRKFVNQKPKRNGYEDRRSSWARVAKYLNSIPSSLDNYSHKADGMYSSDCSRLACWSTLLPQRPNEDSSFVHQYRGLTTRVLVSAINSGANCVSRESNVKRLHMCRMH